MICIYLYFIERLKNELIKSRLSTVWGMYIVLGAVIRGIMLNLALLKAILELSKQITEEVNQLDSNLAVVIAKVVENLGLSEHEPINPIQSAIAALMQSKIAEIGNVKAAKTVLRDDNGFFKKTE